jgi:hypothetical protein
MIPRREFISLLGGAATAWPVGTLAQQRERMRRVGVLFGLAENDPETRNRIAALHDGLEKLGWTVGRNIEMEYRFTGGDSERLVRDSLDELMGSRAVGAQGRSRVIGGHAVEITLSQPGGPDLDQGQHAVTQPFRRCINARS